jgi:hypothetical protein
LATGSRFFWWVVESPADFLQGTLKKKNKVWDKSRFSMVRGSLKTKGENEAKGVEKKIKPGM